MTAPAINSNENLTEAGTGQITRARAYLAWYMQAAGIVVLGALVWFAWSTRLSEEESGPVVLGVAAGLTMVWWGFRERAGKTVTD